MSPCIGLRSCNAVATCWPDGHQMLYRKTFGSTTQHDLISWWWFLTACNLFLTRLPAISAPSVWRPRYRKFVWIAHGVSAVDNRMLERFLKSTWSALMKKARGETRPGASCYFLLFSSHDLPGWTAGTQSRHSWLYCNLTGCWWCWLMALHHGNSNWLTDSDRLPQTTPMLLRWCLRPFLWSKRAELGFLGPGFFKKMYCTIF